MDFGKLILKLELEIAKYKLYTGSVQILGMFSSRIVKAVKRVVLLHVLFVGEIAVWWSASPCEAQQPTQSLDRFIAHPRAIMRIIGASDSGLSSGTAFLVTSGGLLITNHHVIDGKNALYVGIVDKTGGSCSIVPARVIQTDKEKDLAVVRLDCELPCNLPDPMTLSNTTPCVLDSIVAVGFPSSLDQHIASKSIEDSKISDPIAVENFQPNITKGAISKIGSYIIHDAKIGAGNSGGPLISASTNEVVGVNSAVTRAEGFSIAIHAKDVIELLKKARDNRGNIQRLKYFAEQGVSHSVIEYADMLIHGHEGVDKNITQAEILLQRSVERQDKVACRKLADYYLQGTFNQGEPNYEKALGILKILDDAEAHIKLAEIYSIPTTPYYSLENAFAALSTAVEKGSIEARFLLSDAYLQGKGCSKNCQEAFKVLDPITASDSIEEGVKVKAYQRRVDCIADHNDQYMYFYGVFEIKEHLIKRGVPLRAVDYYVLANGIRFSPGNKEKKKSDLAEALLAIEKSSNMGYSRASVAAGVWYFGDRNREKALQYFNLAIKQGHIDGYAGMAMLGYDESQILSTLIQACEQGSGLAAFNLGCFYLEGMGVRKNISKAKQLFEAAYQSDSLDSKIMAETRLKEIEIEQKNATSTKPKKKR